MNIYGVGVVQNEADILGESLDWALRFCRHLWIWDLGSDDNTPQVLSQFGSRITFSIHKGVHFTSSLKGRVFAEARTQIPHDSWIYIFDADEFLEGPVQDVLAAATRKQTHRVGVWQATFYPTPSDLARLRQLGEAEWKRCPIALRINHYRIEWFEWRFLRNAPDFVWDTSAAYSVWRIGERPLKSPHGVPPLFVRHYRYRSPQQVAVRYEVRSEAFNRGYKQFRYDNSDCFENYVRSERELLQWTPGTPWTVPASELWRARVRIWYLRALRAWQRRSFVNRDVGPSVAQMGGE